jgi:hypothetical protein
MKDTEVRGIILRRLYDVRHTNHGMIDLPDGLSIIDIAPVVLGNCSAQLAEQGLIKFGQVMGRPYPSGWGSITAYGVDVIEGTRQPAISVTLDHSVTVHGSHNVQIGGQGNSQVVTMDVEKMTSVVESSGASVVEREEAKSLLKKLSENKLVQQAVGALFKGS